MVERLVRIFIMAVRLFHRSLVRAVSALLPHHPPASLGIIIFSANNQETVNRYAERMAAGEVFPPIDAFKIGEQIIVADGYHRIEAARACGKTEIEANMREGTLKDAVWHAVGANSRHGLPMNREDTRNAITLALREFCCRSNREIARQIGCDGKTVAAVRAELEATAKIPQLGKTIGADGKERTARRGAGSWAHLPFIPKAGRVANALIGLNKSTDQHVHLFMVQEDHRNAGFFFVVHVCMNPGDTGDGTFDFTRRPILPGWAVRYTIEGWIPKGCTMDDLHWIDTEESKDFLWATYIEPERREFIARLKQRAPVVQVAK